MSEEGAAPPPRTPRRDYTPLEAARAVRRLDVALAGLHISAAARMGLTPSELLAIVHIGTERPMSPTEISRLLRMRTGAVTALLDRLERRGYVARKQHPTDRRMLTVELTEACRRDTMAQLGEMVARVVDYATTLSSRERDSVGRVLDDLTAIISETAGQASST